MHGQNGKSLQKRGNTRMLKIMTLFIAAALTAAAAQRVSEVPTGAINGTNAAFTLGYLPYPDTVRVYRNGIRLSVSTDFLLNGQTLTFLAIPTAGDLLMVDYQVLVPSGFHMLLNKATGACIMPSSTNKVLSTSCSGADGQKMSIASASGGYVLTVKSSNQQIDLLNAGTADGTQVIQSPYSGNKSQIWQALSVDNDNFFQLTSVLTNSNSCLTLSGGSVVLQTCSGLDTQKWQWQ
jgi:Ricin-type beta-trefoil lectin domain-like